MNSKKIILFANYLPGLKICEHLVSIGEQLERLYVVNLDDDLTQKIIKSSKLPTEKIF